MEEFFRGTDQSMSINEFSSNALALLHVVDVTIQLTSYLQDLTKSVLC